MPTTTYKNLDGEKQKQLKGKLWTEFHEKQIPFVQLAAVVEKLKLTG